MRPHNIPVQDIDPKRVITRHHPDPVSLNQDDSINDDNTRGNKIFDAKQKGFSIDDFDLIRVIGRGSYAKVCKYCYKVEKLEF